jgi:putative ABC transport system permease protein
MPLVDVITVRPGLFEALSIPILAGRDFEQVRPPGPPEALIDRTLASEFYPSGSPIGATLRMGDDSLTVIGVVEHARQYDLHVDGRSQVFVRNDDFTDATLTWALKTTRDPASLIPEVRAAIRRADASLAIADMRSMDRVVDESLRQQRLSATLVTGFSLGALLLAAMGLFGIVSGAVARRRHELAVRMALGAHHRSVMRLVLREGALLIGIGLLLGVPGILFAGRVLAGTLVGVSPFDPTILLAVAGGLALVTLAACYIPARRVTGIEPASALRQE